VQITKLVCVQFSPGSCYFLSLTPLPDVGRKAVSISKQLKSHPSYSLCAG